MDTNVPAQTAFTLPENSAPAFTLPSENRDPVTSDTSVTPPDTSATPAFSLPPANVAKGVVSDTLDGKTADDLSKSDLREADFAAEYGDVLTPAQRDLLQQSYILRRERGVTMSDVGTDIQNAPGAVAEFAKGGYQMVKHIIPTNPTAQKAAELNAAGEAGAFNAGNILRWAVKKPFRLLSDYWNADVNGVIPTPKRGQA